MKFASHTLYETKQEHTSSTFLALRDFLSLHRDSDFSIEQLAESMRVSVSELETHLEVLKLGDEIAA